MTDNTNKAGNNVNLPDPVGTRYTLAAEEELRLEVPFPRSKQSTFSIVVQHGSCELYGVELAQHKPYILTEGGLKIALFSWHGCTVDIECDEEDGVDIAYTTDETTCNIAFVNTHAQLEALRDQAAAALASKPNDNNTACDGPRVLVCGPAECGKSTLCKVLTAYACKLGRTPLLVDLDPQDSGLVSSVPGTLGACPMSLSSITVDSYATCSGIPPGTASPLLLWHGQDPGHPPSSGGDNPSKASSSSSKAASNQPPLSPELFRAQVDQLCERIDQRLMGDEMERASGVIVNTNGWIEQEGFDLLLHAIRALRIHIVLVLGHDRLYSMLKSKLQQQQQPGSTKPTKVIKLPRSGGVVSRGTDYMRRLRNRSIKRYFYGSLVERPAAAATSGDMVSTTRVPQLTPFLLQLPLDEVAIYKFSSIRLSASLLPVAAAQTSEAIQLVPVLQNGKLQEDDDPNNSSEERVQQVLQHHVLAVCHRHAVKAYEATGKASELYLAGVAGFCTVERIVLDKLHLLSPCAGSLPSNVLLMGNVTWVE